MAHNLRVGSSGLKLVCLLAVTAAVVAAAPIVGTLKIGGEAEVTLTTLDFSPYAPGAPLNGTGQISTLGAGTGVFSPLTFGDVGTIVDRSVDPGVVPAQPAGTPISVMNWITFANPAFRYALDLKFINLGTYSSASCFAAPANGQTCTPPAPIPYGSPYNLSNFIDANAGLSSNATLSVRGDMRNIDTNVVEYLFSGILGAEFLGDSYQEVLAVVLPGGSRLASYSGTIDVTAVIPEASTGVLAIMGAGLVAISRLMRRKSSSD